MTEAANDASRVLGPTFRMAVMAGAVEAVRLHVARGDPLDARDANGMTPLMLACGRNKPQVCSLLLDAGADPWLLTPSGATAFEVAKAAGATDVVELLQQLQTGPTARQPLDGDHLSTNDCLGREDESNAADTGALERDAWLPEPEHVPPVADPRIREEVDAVQEVIRRHAPLDDSAAWDDVQALLPERASLLLNPDHPESIAKLRALFLRAIREGSVPEELVDELARAPEGGPDVRATQSLRIVIQDLGAECDERFEYSTPWDDIRVRVDAEERPDEEEVVSDAVALAESLISPRNDSLRLYQRESARLPLLSAEEEISFGKAMEQGIARACDSLGGWPEGLQYVTHAVAKIHAGEKSIRWLRASGVDDPGDPQAGGGEDAESVVPTDTEVGAYAATDEVAVEITDESEPDMARAPPIQVCDELAELKLLAAQLQALASSSEYEGTAASRVVRSFNLSRSFLLELLDVAALSESDPARRFCEAMATYLRARDAMVRGNLRLAFHHARKAFFSGMDLADLTQEANLGLIRAADKFDWRRGYRFSTYATWWVRQQVLRAVADDSRLIRLPVHLHEKVQQARRVARALEEEFGRPPTHTEIAGLLGVSATSIGNWFRSDQAPEPIDEVDLVARMSIDAQDRFIVSDPSEAVSRGEETARIDEVLSSLKPKEAQVIRMRFGLGGIEPMTLEEVGSCFDITRERARQIETAGLKKLKHPSRSEFLRSMTDEMGAAAQKAQNKSIQNTQRTIESVDSLGPTLRQEGRTDALRQVLERARNEGIVVEDEREHEGSVWVQLVTARTAGERRVLRELLRLGFKLWPGKGYRR